MFNYPEFYFVLILIALIIKSASKLKKKDEKRKASEVSR